MADFTTRDKVALLKDFLNVVGVETEGVEVKITQDADNGMRFYADPEVLIDVKNASGAQIDKGTPVYVSGTHGGSGKPTIEKAKADAAATMPAIGLTLTDLADEAEGYVVAAGTLRNLDTDTPAWDAGDALYVSPTTAGAMTTTRPTGDTELVQKVALVTRRHATAGSVIVMGAGRTNDTPNDSYSGRYDTEAETARSGATTTTEIYYTARPDGDGYAESEVTTSTPAGAVIERRLYYSDKFDADPDTSGDWTLYTTQPADDTAFATAKAALLAGLSDTDGTANTRGTLPVSLKMEHQFVTDLLLDDYPGAAAAYSVRKLRKAYSGSAMRIREDSGNTETDIGFDSNGDLDTAAIASHCGSANGYVVTWYDQSGNGLDAAQATTTAQPKIYNGTVTLTQNGQPALELDGTDDHFDTSVNNPFTYTGGVSCIAVTYKNATAYDSYETIVSAGVSGNGSTNLENTLAFGYGNNADHGSPRPTVVTDIWRPSGMRIASAVSTSEQHLLGFYINNWSTHRSTGMSNMRLNGSDESTSTYRTYNPTGLLTNPMKIGVFDEILATSFFGGSLQEIILYASDQNTNRTGIDSDINTYFSIYP